MNYRANVLAVQGRSELAHEEWKARWLEGCGFYGRPQREPSPAEQARRDQFAAVDLPGELPS